MSRSYRSLGRSLHRDQCACAGEWANRYAALGWNPLPSRADEKRPALGAYRRYLDEPIPRAWLDDWLWPNVQLVMGSRWGICAIDIDGPGGRDRWNAMTFGMGRIIDGAPPFCWAPRPDGGHHEEPSGKILFRWPFFRFSRTSLPTTVLWSGPGHNEVRFIGDRGLIVVPPSVHPDRKVRHEWFTFCEIDEIPLLPDWVVEAVLATRPDPASPPAPRPQPLRRRPRAGASFAADEVLAAVGDRKVDIAVRYGLRPSGNGDPFLKCRAVDRDDHRPSCSIDRRTGRFFDWGLNESISFFELLSRLDPAAFPTWEDARDVLGASYLGRVDRRG